MYFSTNTFIALCHALTVITVERQNEPALLPPKALLLGEGRADTRERRKSSLPPLMPDEDNNFDGSLVLDFRK